MAGPFGDRVARMWLLRLRCSWGGDRVRRRARSGTLTSGRTDDWLFFGGGDGCVRKTKQSQCSGAALSGVVATPCRGTRRAVVAFRRDRVARVVNTTHKRSPPWVLTGRGGGDIGGEFDPGSGSTLAACLMHASRTGLSSGGLRGGRVRNAWITCPVEGASLRKRRVIPHELADRVGLVRKARKSAIGGVCVRLVSWWGNGSPRR